MQHLELSPEVSAALECHQPVVALESTIIAHGMPWPENVKTGQELEQVVREEGAVPATIALINGKMKVGLNIEELNLLGNPKIHVAKASRRDLPWLLMKKMPGATTVAATMCIAEKAGIAVFATGGIGGVHRGATDTFDISADLQELARTNVAVVCAGAKSILDIGHTLEYLETHGVPVVGFQTDEFPAFYTRSSGFGVECRLDAPVEVARFMLTKWSAGLDGGIVVANPIPADKEPEYSSIAQATEKALEEARQRHLRGKQITPFLLRRIKELTGGESLRANIELALNNARLAARIAVAYSKLKS